MNVTLIPVVALILVALTFDFINGFHDAANSIATVVSTRVLSPGKAVIWAAFFNFVAAFTFGTAVAKTVGSGLVDIHIISFAVIFAALVALVWIVGRLEIIVVPVLLALMLSALLVPAVDWLDRRGLPRGGAVARDHDIKGPLAKYCKAPIAPRTQRCHITGSDIPLVRRE